MVVDHPKSSEEGIVARDIGGGAETEPLQDSHQTTEGGDCSLPNNHQSDASHQKRCHVCSSSTISMSLKGHCQPRWTKQSCQNIPLSEVPWQIEQGRPLRWMKRWQRRRDSTEVARTTTPYSRSTPQLTQLQVLDEFSQGQLCIAWAMPYTRSHAPLLHESTNVLLMSLLCDLYELGAVKIFMYLVRILIRFGCKSQAWRLRQPAAGKSLRRRRRQR